MSKKPLAVEIVWSELLLCGGEWKTRKAIYEELIAEGHERKYVDWYLFCLSNHQRRDNAMADCETAIQRITFDISDPQITNVRIEITFSGDCPHVLKRIYKKSFPARFPIAEIATMEGGITDYLEW